MQVCLTAGINNGTLRSVSQRRQSTQNVTARWRRPIRVRVCCVAILSKINDDDDNDDDEPGTEISVTRQQRR